MRRLNSCFRGKNQPTDVLSFPADASAKGFAGDIAISLEIAERNARLLGHSAADEIRILILHGMLHLAGYDHENDKGEMAKKESLLRRRFDLPTGLIERSDRMPVRKKSFLISRMPPTGSRRFAVPIGSRRPNSNFPSCCRAW